LGGVGEQGRGEITMVLYKKLTNVLLTCSLSRTFVLFLFAQF